MPVKTGYDVLRWMKAAGLCLPVIVITGYPDEDAFKLTQETYTNDEAFKIAMQGGGAVAANALSMGGGSATEQLTGMTTAKEEAAAMTQMVEMVDLLYAKVYNVPPVFDRNKSATDLGKDEPP
jgi:CheY-like chemotaxis protein